MRLEPSPCVDELSVEDQLQCAVVAHAVEQVGVVYSLTPMGESLREPFCRLYGWTVEHSAQIQRCQREYDERVRTETKPG